MKLLFWNINKKDNADLALTCMREEGVGIAAFAEFSGTDFSDELLMDSGYHPIGFGGCDKVKVIAREPIEILDCYEESRFTVLPMKIGEIYFVVAAAHLVDRMSSTDPEPRLVDIRKMMDVSIGPCPHQRSYLIEWQFRQPNGTCTIARDRFPQGD